MSDAATPHPSAPEEAPQAKLSAMQRVIGVFTSPSETFADIARVPKPMVAIVLLTVIALVVCAVMMQRVEWRGFMEKQMAKGAQWDQLSAEQKNQRLDMGMKIIPFQIYGFGLLGPTIFTLVLAAIYLGAFNLFLSAGLKFKQCFAIVAHASLVSLISSPLAIIVMLLKRPGEVDPEHMMATNVGEYLSSDAPKALLKFAGSLDIFMFWILALLVIGFSVANPKKISKGAAAGVIFGLWAVWVLAKVGWTVIAG